MAYRCNRSVQQQQQRNTDMEPGHNFWPKTQWWKQDQNVKTKTKTKIVRPRPKLQDQDQDQDQDQLSNSKNA